MQYVCTELRVVFNTYHYYVMFRSMAYGKSDILAEVTL